MDREPTELDHYIKKADLEIKIVKHKLEVGARPQLNCVNYYKNQTFAFVFMGKEDQIQCE